MDHRSFIAHWAIFISSLAIFQNHWIFAEINFSPVDFGSLHFFGRICGSTAMDRKGLRSDRSVFFQEQIMSNFRGSLIKELAKTGPDKAIRRSVSTVLMVS